MVDSEKQLIAAVRDLEHQLACVENLDPAARQLLTDAIADIQAKLKASDSNEANWSERLSTALVDLQTSHPSLATMVTRVCDFLDQAGV